jgi:hypothetical protein
MMGALSTTEKEMRMSVGHVGGLEAAAAAIASLAPQECAQAPTAPEHDGGADDAAVQAAAQPPGSAGARPGASSGAGSGETGRVDVTA